MTPPPKNLGNSLVLWRNGAVVRALLTALLLVAAVFICALAVLMSGDQWLECVRQRPGLAACVLRERYPLGVVQEASLPPVVGTRTERRVPRNYRERPHMVVILEHEGLPATEHPGVGKLGERADPVAGELSAFLGGEGEPTRAWHFREAGPRALSFGMFAVGLLVLVLVPSFFQRVRVSYDADRGEVNVRTGRWPLAPRRWTCPLDNIDCVQLSETTNPTGVFYGVRLQPGPSSGAEPCELGTQSRLRAPMEALARQLDDALAAWRNTR
jgi:hypothetical protein